MRRLIARLSRCVAAMLLLAPAAFAQYSEAEVKAAFVFNVAKFAEWPADALPNGARLRVCAPGSQGGLGAALAALDGRVVGGHAVEVVGGASAQACHILVALGDAPDARRAPAATAGTLTIGDGLEFIDGGGMIGVGIVDNRVQFAVNLPAVRRAGIRLPAQFLKLAKRVRE